MEWPNTPRNFLWAAGRLQGGPAGLAGIAAEFASPGDGEVTPPGPRREIRPSSFPTPGRRGLTPLQPSSLPPVSHPEGLGSFERGFSKPIGGKRSLSSRHRGVSLQCSSGLEEGIDPSVASREWERLSCGGGIALLVPGMGGPGVGLGGVAAGGAAGSAAGVGWDCRGNGNGTANHRDWGSQCGPDWGLQLDPGVHPWWDCKRNGIGIGSQMDVGFHPKRVQNCDPGGSRIPAGAVLELQPKEIWYCHADGPRFVSLLGLRLQQEWDWDCKGNGIGVAAQMGLGLQCGWIQV